MLITSVGDVAGRSILELGSGNGYLLPLLATQQRSKPQRTVSSDISKRLVRMAAARDRGGRAGHVVMDAARRFPFAPRAFDLVLAVMLFNELSNRALRTALGEISRVMSPSGHLVGAALHPRFVHSLERRGELRRGRVTTMPAAGNLRVPVVRRSLDEYQSAFTAARLYVEFTDVRATESVYTGKPGLRKAGGVPLAFFFEARHSGDGASIA